MIIPDIMTNEALLEMLYFEPLKELLEDFYGLDFLRLYKPTPQAETWIGYDQAWVKTELSQADFENTLKGTLHQATPAPDCFVGYFMQFKCVKSIRQLTPTRYDTHECPVKEGVITPCYRSELSAKKSTQTGKSQHQTLRELCALGGWANVYYAFPYIFGWEDFERSTRLDKLQIADVAKAKDYPDENTHNAWFKQVGDDVLWCSNGEWGSAVSAVDWSDNDRVEFPKIVNGSIVSRWLRALEKHGLGLPPQLTVWQFK